MNAIKKRRNMFAALLTVGVVAAVCFQRYGLPEAALICGAGSVLPLVLLILQARRLREVRLISDNRILAVPSAVITRPESGETRKLEETVVSTFGVLAGGRVYRWGCDGFRGTRLTAIEIDRSRISLTLGGENQPLRIELPHGLSDRQTVLEICRKLQYETASQPWFQAEYEEESSYKRGRGKVSWKMELVNRVPLLKNRVIRNQLGLALGFRLAYC